jgi:c-di-GMP-binding flagellar brake protein YcgR
MNDLRPLEEKRQSPRTKTCIPVRYKVLQQGMEHQSTGAATFDISTGAATFDISTGGLRFTTSECLPGNCRLILELDLPSVEAPIKTESKVAWIERATGEENGKYYVGSRFMELTEKDRELISRYVGAC